MEKLNKNRKYLFINTTLYVFIIFLLITTVTFAWFSVTNNDKAALIVQISDVEAEYEFYVYNDPTHSGSSNLTLFDNVTANPNEYDKYLFIADPTATTLIDGFTAPGERFSFAIKISNIGSTTGHVDLSFSNVESFNYERVENKIQIAYQYSVTKISYISDVMETDDQKDLQDMNYFSQHFEYVSGLSYDLVQNIPLQYQDTNSVVIYFDFYFDPFVYGIDENDIPYDNSNIFMGQTLTVYTINMALSA